MDKNIKEISNFKYVHIMLHSSIHNKSVIELLNNRDLGFIPDDHLFIIKDKYLYEKCKEYSNVLLDENIIKAKMSEFKEYGKKSKKIFLHSHSLTIKHLFNLDKATIQKIVWCVWGHDLYNHKWHSLSNEKPIFHKLKILIKNLLIKAYSKLWSYKTKQFYAVGVGFTYDGLEVKRKFGKNMRVLTTPYGYRKDNLKYINENFEFVAEESDLPYKIMVGHSSFEFLNHIDIMKKLEKFKNKNITISLILSYGNDIYAKVVEEYAKNAFNSKVEIINEYMTRDEYTRYLNTVDACILDYKHQSALGNIFNLLYLGKKLYLNDEGILKTALLLEGIETYNVKDIELMNYETFTSSVKNPEIGYNYATKILADTTYATMWSNTLKELQ